MSRHFNRSARLRDLLVYVSERVLDEEVSEIHEQEVGCNVFGRSADYDTSSDNIVRVHASMLRKRLEQYFAEEGSREPLIVEIRKGNYAPVFHPRPEVEFPATLPPEAPSGVTRARSRDWRLIAVSALAMALGVTAVWLAITRVRDPVSSQSTPNVSALWSNVLRAGRPTDIVIDDAGVGLYQELTGQSVTLSDYFNRNYLRGLPGGSDAGGIPESAAEAMVLRRQSSFAATNALWRLSSSTGVNLRAANLRFARDFTFRELKADNSILLGNSHTNPWIENFDGQVGLRWRFDAAGGVYFPVDSWNGDKAYRGEPAGDSREGFCAIDLVPNPGGGNVLIIAGTGGSAINAGTAFLSDERALADLRARLHGAPAKPFPYFELLLRVKGRTSSARDSSPEIVRAPRH